MTSCPICYEHQSANEYYRMTVHKEEYHKLIKKIHEKIESLQNRMNELDIHNGYYEETQYQKYKEFQFELKSLLEENK